MKEQLNFRFIHYWKSQILNETLEELLIKTKTNSKIWCILLDEKLRRNEI